MVSYFWWPVRFDSLVARGALGGVFSLVGGGVGAVRRLCVIWGISTCDHVVSRGGTIWMASMDSLGECSFGLSTLFLKRTWPGVTGFLSGSTPVSGCRASGEFTEPLEEHMSTTATMRPVREELVRVQYAEPALVAGYADDHAG